MDPNGRQSERRSNLPLVPWTDDTRRGSFESFYSAYGSLERADFQKKVDSPVLMTAVSTDSATWSGTLVLKISKLATNAKIAITNVEGSGGDLEAQAGRIYVGRTPENDVVIAAPTVSKRHAYFSFRDKTWELTDNDSANGTVIEGMRLKPNRRERIRRSLATIEFGPDARFVFMLPESVFDLFQEIHRSRGIRATSKLKLPPPPAGRAADQKDFEALEQLPAEEDPNTSHVLRSAHPSKPLKRPTPEPEPAEPDEPDEPVEDKKQSAQPAQRRDPPSGRPRHRATWQGKRPELDGDAEALGKSTDKIAVRVGKTPQEIEDINFDYALRAVVSLGGLVHKLEAILKVEGQVVLLLGEGSRNSIDECKEALVKMRPLVRAIRMEMTVGDRKPVEIFRIEE